MLNPRFPAPVNTYNPTVHALVDAVYDALSHIVPGQGARRRQRQPLDHPRRAHDLYRQGLRAIRDHRRRRRRARQQGRRVRHHGQPEQRQDRAGRDHRERVSDARPALRADPRIPAAPGVSRRARHPPRISQSRGRALLHPLDEARRSRRTAAPAAAPAAPATSGSIPTAGRQAPADALRRLSAQGRRRLPARHARRRRPRRSRSRAIPSACSPTCARAMCRSRRPNATTASRLRAPSGRG